MSFKSDKKEKLWCSHACDGQAKKTKKQHFCTVGLFVAHALEFRVQLLFNALLFNQCTKSTFVKVYVSGILNSKYHNKCGATVSLMMSHRTVRC